MRWEYHNPLPASWETCIQDKMQQVELDMEQWTVSKLGKEYVQAVYCLPAYILICRVHHVKCWTRWITTWNQDSVQFSSVAQSCLTLCNPMNHSTPGQHVHHQLSELTNSCPSSWWCHSAISFAVVLFSSCPQSLPASGVFPMSQLFKWGGQSIRVSASASVLM